MSAHELEKSHRQQLDEVIRLWGLPLVNEGRLTPNDLRRAYAGGEIATPRENPLKAELREAVEAANELDRKLKHDPCVVDEHAQLSSEVENLRDGIRDLAKRCADVLTADTALHNQRRAAPASTT